MTMTTEKPLVWIKQVDSLLLNLEQKPQFGLADVFDWEQFEHLFAARFELASLRIDRTSKGWLLADERTNGLGTNQLTLTFELPDLKTPAYFITTEQDLKRLMAKLLGGERQAAYFYDSSLVEGFYYYIASEILCLLDQVKYIPSLNIRLAEPSHLIEEPCFGVEVSFNLDAQTICGRVLLPESFRQEWKGHFSNMPPPRLSDELKENIQVDVGLEVGHGQMSFQEWKDVSLGDFIILDHCSYDPLSKKGGVILTLEQTPLFRGRFKKEGIKLTEYPIYEEAKVNMEEKPPAKEDLYGDQEAEEEELTSEEPITISPEQLPVQLTVEVGRLRMTAKELMNLSPGNLIDLSISPEQGVDLMINGKKVGRGELIRLGETLGVRILSF